MPKQSMAKIRGAFQRCPICGVTFRPSHSRNQVTCSRECAYSWSGRKASAEDKEKHALAITPPSVLVRRHQRRRLPDSPDLEAAKAEYFRRGGKITVLDPASETRIDDESMEVEPSVRWNTVREGMSHRVPIDDDGWG